MDLQLRRLPEVDPPDIIELMSDPLVRRHMPLARGEFGPAECAAFIAAKEALWREHGYGPWAFVIDGEFAGWGGLQPEGGDADLGIVLHQRFWGHGRVVAERLLHEAFHTFGFESVIILLPVSRSAAHGVRRLGFQPDGEVDLAGVVFQRFRLFRQRNDFAVGFSHDQALVLSDWLDRVQHTERLRALVDEEPVESLVERGITGRVHPENLERALEVLSTFIGYGYDDFDRAALAGALDGNSFEYPLQGSPALTVGMARAVGSTEVVLIVRGRIDDVLAARVETLLDLL